jgi:hypothetical protein
MMTHLHECVKCGYEILQDGVREEPNGWGYFVAKIEKHMHVDLDGGTGLIHKVDVENYDYYLCHSCLGDLRDVLGDYLG